jgi:hypothetical protein
MSANDRPMIPQNDIREVIVFRPRHIWHFNRVFKQLFSAGSDANEAHSGCEDDFAALTSLYGSCCKRTARSNSLYMIDDWDIFVSSKNKEAVHAVNVKVFVHRPIRCCKALSNDAATKESTSSWRSP